jgi:putative flippase GtrA
MNSLWNIVQKYRHFLLYSIIGVSGVFIDFFSYGAMVSWTSISYLLANIVSTTLGICNNFIWNAWFNFRKTDNIKNRFFTFYFVGMLGLLLSTVILYILVQYFSIQELVAKMVTIVFVVIVQYSLNKKYSFQ